MSMPVVNCYTKIFQRLFLTSFDLFGAIWCVGIGDLVSPEEVCGDDLLLFCEAVRFKSLIGLQTGRLRVIRKYSSTLVH